MSGAGAFLPIDPVGQIGRNTCWAACAEMVLRHYGLERAAQEVVAEKWRERSRAGEPLTSCDVPLEAESVIPLFAQWSVPCEQQGVAELETVQSELDAGRPLLVGAMTGSGEHMMVVRGWGRLHGRPYLDLNDPLGCGGEGRWKRQYYESLMQGGEHSIWRRTWTTLPPPQ